MVFVKCPNFCLTGYFFHLFPVLFYFFIMVGVVFLVSSTRLFGYLPWRLCQIRKSSNILHFFNTKLYELADLIGEPTIRSDELGIDPFTSSWADPVLIATVGSFVLFFLTLGKRVCIFSNIISYVYCFCFQVFKRNPLLLEKPLMN